MTAYMARKGNPISVRLNHNRSSDSSWFSEGDRGMTESFLPHSNPIFKDLWLMNGCGRTFPKGHYIF